MTQLTCNPFPIVIDDKIITTRKFLAPYRIPLRNTLSSKATNQATLYMSNK